jgi:hypothetical protein
MLKVTGEGMKQRADKRQGTGGWGTKGQRNCHGKRQ